MRQFSFRPFMAILAFVLFYSTICIADSPLLDYTENKGQWDKKIHYRTDIHGGHIELTSQSIRYLYFSKEDIDEVHHLKHEHPEEVYSHKVNCYAYELQFANANVQSKLSAAGKRSYYKNYFLGNDAKRWAGNVGVYESVLYENLYTGIDLKVYASGQLFKYDVVVKPGANPSVVRFNYKGVKPLLLADGSIQLNIGFAKVAEMAPYTYQLIGNQKVVVKSMYQLSADGSLSFVFPEGYDKNYELIIDPTLVFATYSGSTATTFGFSATYDLSGSLYAGGEVFSIGWPVSVGAFQVAYGGGVDCGINKYTPNGNALIYSTYYGGDLSDLPNNMVVNTNNELAMTGSTSSSNLPTTPGCFDPTSNGGTDAYVVRFNATGTAMLGSTYIGGNAADASNSLALSPNSGDANRGEIAYDDNGVDLLIAISTSSANFPVTPTAYQSTIGGGQDGVFFKMNGTCSTLLFSTYIGGSNNDAAFSLARKSNGNWVLAGGTSSNDFPTTAGAMTPTYQSATDAFVCEFNTNATSLIYSTYIGTTSYDHAFKVQVDAMDTVYVCGQTAGATFPVSPGVYNNPNTTIFIMKLNPDLSNYALSTRIGQTTNLVPTAFLKDVCGNIYFSGFQAGQGLPLTPNAHQSTQGGFWLCVLSGDFTQLIYATYMGVPGDHVDGGTSRFDPAGIVYQSVCTNSPAFYQTPGCHAPNNMAGSWDVASYKFDFEQTGPQASFDISPNDSGCTPHPVVFTNNSIAGVSYFWDFGDGNTDTSPSPTHTYTSQGVYTVMMVAYNPNGCITSDTSYTTITIVGTPDATFTTDVTLGCEDDTVSFLNNPVQPGNTQFGWAFGDGNFAIMPDPTHIYTTQGNYVVVCIATNGFCADTFALPVNVLHPINAAFAINTPDSVCIGQAITFNAGTSVPIGGLQFEWDMGNGFTTSSGTNPIFNYQYPLSGYYTVTLTVTDTIGCTDTYSMNIFVDIPGFASFTASDSVICLGDPVFFKDSLPATTFGFAWDFGDGTLLLNEHNPYYSWSSPGTYQVTLTNDNPVCPDDVVTKNIIVNSYPLVNLGPDTSYCPGGTSTILLSNQLNPGGTFDNLWSTGSMASSIAVAQAGIYWLRVSNGPCTTTDSITIDRDCYLNIPNSFSPDGDGLNDYFLPRELLSSGLTAFRMDIYNRWGEKVFATNAIDGRGWDGKHNGVPQSTGVFVYVIEATFHNNLKKTYSGNVTLVR